MANANAAAQAAAVAAGLSARAPIAVPPQPVLRAPPNDGDGYLLFFVKDNFSVESYVVVPNYNCDLSPLAR